MQQAPSPQGLQSWQGMGPGGCSPLHGRLHVCAVRGPGLGKLSSDCSPRGGQGRASARSGLCPPKLTAFGFGQSRPAVSLPPSPSREAGSRLKCLSCSDPGPCLLGEVGQRHWLPLQPRKQCRTIHCHNRRMGSCRMGILKETSRKVNLLQESVHATSVSHPPG